jgi:glucose/arabinose dehydrogenase
MKVVCILAFALASLLPAQPPVNSRPFRLDELKTPPGFEVSIYARLNGTPRLMTFGPNGVLYVAALSAIFAVPQTGQPVIASSRWNLAHSLQFQGQDLFVAAADGIYRLRNAVTDDLVIRSVPEKIADLPVGGQHSTRTLGFGPDGGLYVTAGSTCNFCVESDSRRATMMRFDADGSNMSVFARGLRNSVDFAWHPATGDLWANDNGGDGLGDDIPPDEVNIIQQGGDYGWPDCYGQKRAADWGSGARTDRCGVTIGPEVELQAHSAPLGISFYTGAQFPAAYINDAFVAFHGSWNRNTPTGYKVVRVHGASGRGAGYEDFLWGFFDPATRTRSGRPVHAINGPDGALYVSDDDTGYIYRVAYTGPRINPRGFVQRAPGVYEMYGENFVNDPAQFTILVNGVPLDTLYVSANQVNFVLPGAVPGSLTITVKNEKGMDQAVLAP